MNQLLANFSTSQFSSLGERLNLDRIRTEAGNLQTRFANIRPPQEFFDFKRISKPQNFGEAQGRISYNLSYFSTNYALIVVMLSIYSLLTNLLLLFVIIFVVGGMYGISMLQGSDLELGFTRLTSSQLYTGLLVVAIPLGLLASPISTIFWLIGASAGLILTHATLMDKPIETAFAEESV